MLLQQITLESLGYILGVRGAISFSLRFFSRAGEDVYILVIPVIVITGKIATFVVATLVPQTWNFFEEGIRYYFYFYLNLLNLRETNLFSQE